MRLRALGWRNRSFQRCSVLAALSILAPPAILLHVAPTLALGTISSKVLDSGIVLTSPLPFLSLSLSFSCSFLAFAVTFAFLVALAYLAFSSLEVVPTRV